MMLFIAQAPIPPVEEKAASSIIEGLRQLGELGVVVLVMVFLIIAAVSVLVLGIAYFRGRGKHFDITPGLIDQLGKISAEYTRSNQAVIDIAKLHNEEIAATRASTDKFQEVIARLVESLTNMPTTLATLLGDNVRAVAESNLKYYNEKQTQMTQAVSDLEAESIQMREQIEALIEKVNEAIETTKRRDKLDLERYQLVIDALLDIQAKLDMLLKIPPIETSPIVNPAKEGET